ncbi:MAG TPA: hypothetical protein VMW58_08875 [Anaerolineae bacterium]|nr:hypothetical protein [Anaerolineae bacterium]
MPAERLEEEETGEEFGELAKFTIAGFAAGLALGVLLDFLGQQLSPVGQWLVRTVSGEGESVFEGFYALRQRFRRAKGTMAEAYGWGKLLGMMAPWIVDWGSRALGVDVYGVQGFYIPFVYSMSDQIGANVSGLLFLRREVGSWPVAMARYVRHPVLLTSLTVVLLVPAGLLLARVGGFSPTTQTYTALEAIAANLCWVPPLVGALVERSRATRAA